MPDNQNADVNFGFMQRSETWLSITFLMTLVILIVPLPTILLDLFLACNIAAAIMLLLVTLGAKKPLDVSVFPSMLLLLTLFRLSLNVATTRLILLNGDAGKIVLTFGDFVVGGNLIVGIVIFLILVTIQFIVITKGATRISEVNARFTLDALPGKQMAIDAELNSQAITESEAKARRSNLTREAEFYGAMDGASKYVRGDAIAGLVIMVVNILGGVLLGVQNGQSVLDALQVYSILTIGDGLVSQIPALIIATSAGILVTKSASESSLGEEINSQVKQGYQSLYIGAFIMFIVAFTPGFPKIPFMAIGVGIYFFVAYAKKNHEADDQAAEDAKTSAQNQPQEATPEEKSLDQFLQNDRIVLEIGAGLIPLIEPAKGSGISERIATMREDAAKEHGFWIPQARIRDNLQIGVNEYRFLISGREVGHGELMVDEYLAVNPGTVKIEIEGTDTRDPAFDLPAKWISEGNRRKAEMVGYTVVDAPTVLITHLGEALRKHAHELLSREDLQKMLDKLKEIAPTTVEELKPDTVRPTVLHQVLVKLLAEGIPITSLQKIVESAIHYGVQTKDIGQLTEKIRSSIGHLICDRFRDENGNVRVIILEPKLEHHLRQINQGGTLAMSPHSLEKFVKLLQSKWETSRIKDEPAAVLVDSSIRQATRQTIARSLPEMSVIAYNEIPADLLIESVSLIRYVDVIDANDADVELSLLTPSASEPNASQPNAAEGNS